MLYQLNIGLLRDNPKLIHIAEFISLNSYRSAEWGEGL